MPDKVDLEDLGPVDLGEVAEGDFAVVLPVAWLADFPVGEVEKTGFSFELEEEVRMLPVEAVLELLFEPDLSEPDSDMLLASSILLLLASCMLLVMLEEGLLLKFWLVSEDDLEPESGIPEVESVFF